MLRHNDIETLVIANPFDRDDVEHMRIPAEGKTLATLLKEVETQCAVAINGRIVEPDDYETTIPQGGDKMVVSSVPQGGGDSGKSILRLVAVVALSYFTFGGGGGSFWASTFGKGAGAYFAKSAAFIGGSLLVNEVLPPVMAETPDQSLAASPSQTYGIDGPKNTSREGIPYPLVFGSYRIAGNFINTRSLNKGNKQELYLLMNAGEGEVAGLRDVEINQEPASTYDAKVITRNGTANQEVIEDFSDASNDRSIGITLEEKNDDVSLTSQNSVVRLELDLVFPQGLYGVTNAGEYRSRNVGFIGVYREDSDPPSRWYRFDDEEREPVVRVTLTNKSGDTIPEPVFIHESFLSLDSGFDIGDYQDLEVIYESTSGHSGGENEGEGFEIDRYDVFGTRVSDGTTREEIGNINKPSDTYFDEDVAIVYSGRSPDTVRYTMKSPTLEQGLHEVYVRRTTASHDNSDPDRELTVRDSVTVTNFREFRGVDGISYNYTALVGLVATVDNQLNSIPTVTFINDGLLIPVYERDPAKPSQFTHTLEASDNPAWITLAMYTNKRWGAKMALSRFELEEFYEWAQICEENDWKFNGVFDSKMNIAEAAKAVAKVGRAKIIPVGTRIGVNIQTPQQMTQCFTSSSIKKGTLDISWMPTSDRANVVDCTFYDIENNYKPRTFRYHNDALISSDQEFRPTELNLFGVVHYEQAVKECEFALNFNQLSQKVEFEVDVQAISSRVGQVVGVQHEMPAWGQGGRIESGSTKRTVMLDRPIKMEEGQEYYILTHNSVHELGSITVSQMSGDYETLISTSKPDENAKRILINGQDIGIVNVTHDEDNSRYLITINDDIVINGSETAELYNTDAAIERKVVTVEGESTVVTLDAGEPDLPIAPEPLSQFSFGLKEKQIKKFLITNISGQGVESRKISGIEYYEEVLQDGLVDSLPNFSNFQNPISVNSLNVEEVVFGNTTEKRLKLLVRWQYNTDNFVQRANVYASFDGNSEENIVGRGEGTSCEIFAIDGYETVKIRVVPLNGQGEEVLSEAKTIEHTIESSLLPPKTPWITPFRLADTVSLNWGVGKNDLYTKAIYRYDIYLAEGEIGEELDNFPEDYTLITSTLSENYQHEGLVEERQYKFAIVTVNSLNNALQSQPTFEIVETPSSFEKRTSESGIEIWYSEGVDDGVTLGNPDTHPENWSMTYTDDAVLQATLTWQGFQFQPWAIRSLESDSIGMVYLGEFASFPASPEEGDLILHTGNNAYYVRRGGVWELFLDRNVSGLSTQFSPNGIQDESDPLYENWSNSFREGVDLFMRQSTDSGTTWSQSIRFVGEEGTEGRYMDFRFARGATAPSIDVNDPDPENYTDSIPTGTEPVWYVVAKKNPDGSFYESAQWSTPDRLNGKDGEDGEDGEDAQVLEIGYPNGLSIKNGSGTVSLNVKLVDKNGVQILTGSGHPQLYDGNTAIGRSASFNANQISGVKTITLKDADGNELDAVTIIDVEDGDSATVGEIAQDNSLHWVKGKNDGAWSPATLSTTMTATFYKDGDSVATRTLIANLESSTGKITVSSDSSTGESTTVTVSGNDSPSPVVTVVHNNSNARVSESLFSVKGGDRGDSGGEYRPITLFRRSASPLDDQSLPDTLSYDFDSKSLSNTGSWSTSIPSGSNPLYQTVGVAYSSNGTGVDSSIDLSTPSVFARDGDTGKSYYVGKLYKRASSKPNPPGTSATYSFTNNAFTSVPSGWSAAIPDDNGQTCYSVDVSFSVDGPTGTDTSSDYSVVSELVKSGKDGDDGDDGEPGYSYFRYTIYKRKSGNAPNKPSGGSFNFGTNAISTPSGWSATPPAGDDPLYGSTAEVSTQGDTGIAVPTYSDVYHIVSNGRDGDNGERGAGNYSHAISGTSWSNSEANSATPGDNVAGDRVTLYNNAQEYVETRFWNPGSGGFWDDSEVKIIDANLIVNGDAIIPQIFSQQITLSKRVVASNGDVSATMSAVDTNVFEAKNGSRVLFSIGSNGNHSIDGAGLKLGSVKASSLDQSVYDAIQESLGTPTLSTGGYRSGEFEFESSDEGNAVYNLSGFEHGSNAMNFTIEVSAILVYQNSPGAIDYSLRLQYRRNGGSWQTVETWYKVGTTSQTPGGYYHVKIEDTLEKTIGPSEGTFDFRVVCVSCDNQVNAPINATFAVQEAGTNTDGIDWTQVNNAPSESQPWPTPPNQSEVERGKAYVHGINFTNYERGQYDGSGDLYYDASEGLYIKTTNAMSSETGGDLLWSAANFTAADGLNVTYTSNGRPTMSVDGSVLREDTDITIAKSFPKLILESSRTGDAWTSQGALFQLGEADNASLKLTYQGGGKGYIGMGNIDANGVPAYSAIRFNYNSNDIRFLSTPNVNGANVLTVNSDLSVSNLSGRVSYSNLPTDVARDGDSIAASRLTGTISDSRLPGTISSNITGNAASADNADKLDGKHASAFMEVGDSISWGSVSNKPDIILASPTNGQWGMVRPDGNDTGWIRTTKNGLLPWDNNNADGCSSLGNSSWPFKNLHVVNAYVDHLTTYQDAYGPDFITNSDRRLKKDFEDIENPLELIDALWGGTYYQKELKRRAAGIIAQDLQSVLPEAVNQHPDTGMLGVSDSGTIALLVEVVKALKSRLIDVERRVR